MMVPPDHGSTPLGVAMAAALIGLAVMALFSGLETGFYSVSRVRLAVRLARGDRSALVLRGELANTTGALIALLLLINLAGFLQAWGVAVWLEGLGLDPLTISLVDFAILLPVMFLVGDLIPKDLFRVHAESWTYPLAWSIRLVRSLATWVGVVWAIQHLASAVARMVGGTGSSRALTSREEVARAVREGEGAGLLRREDIDVADRVLRLRSLGVGACVVPWGRVSSIPAGLDGDDRGSRVARLPFTRVPVVSEQGVVVGMLATLDAVLSPATPTSELMVPPVVVQVDTPIATALGLMRRHRTQTAIVGSAHAPIGIVTLKDLARGIVGEAAWLGA